MNIALDKISVFITSEMNILGSMIRDGGWTRGLTALLALEYVASPLVRRASTLEIGQ